MCSQENPEEGVSFKGAPESKLSLIAPPNPVLRSLSSTRIQNLKNLKGTASPSGSGVAGCSAMHSTETPQGDSKARTQSADMTLLSWTWMLRETEGKDAQGPVVSHGDSDWNRIHDKEGCCLTSALQEYGTHISVPIVGSV